MDIMEMTALECGAAIKEGKITVEQESQKKKKKKPLKPYLTLLKKRTKILTHILLFAKRTH